MAMRPGDKALWEADVLVFALALSIAVLGTRAGTADELGRLGRLFRFGGGNPNASAATPPEPKPPTPAPDHPTASESPLPATPNPSAATPRIVPRPRVTRAITESDPIITRITLNRSDDGHVFGMFLQVYADGTILDTEGVHHVGQEALKPLIEALQVGDLYRIKGHCGAPATDFVESVQMIIYERSLGRLRAHSFSYSGNPQGCDSALRHLHATLDNLQARITRPISPGAAAGAGAAAPLPANEPPPLPAPSVGSPAVIPLTAPN